MSWFLQKEIENDDFPKNYSLIEWWEKKILTMPRMEGKKWSFPVMEWRLKEV